MTEKMNHTPKRNLEDKIKKILIVDSNYEERFSRHYAFIPTLQNIGYEFEFVKTGEEALAAAGKSIDLVIQDLNTKDIPGVDLLRRIKEKTPDSEIIVYTAAQADEKELSDAGAYYSTQKPCKDEHDMINLVDKAVNHKEFTLRYIRDMKKKLFQSKEDKVPRTIIYCKEEAEKLSAIFQQLGERYKFVEKSYDSIAEHVRNIKPGSEEANSIAVISSDKKNLIRSLSKTTQPNSNLEIPVLALVPRHGEELYDEEVMIKALGYGAADCSPLIADRFKVVAEYLFEAHKTKYRLGKEGKPISIKSALNKTKKPVFFIIDNSEKKDYSLEELLVSDGFNTKVINSSSRRRFMEHLKPSYLLFNPEEVYDFHRMLSRVEAKTPRDFLFTNLYVETNQQGIKIILRGDEYAIPEVFHKLIEREQVHFIPHSLRNHELKRRVMEILDADLTATEKKTDRGNYVLILTGATCSGKDTVANQIKDMRKNEFEIVPHYKTRSHHRLGERSRSWRGGLFSFSRKYNYKAYGDYNYVDVEGVRETLSNRKNVIIPCSADGAQKVEAFIRDSGLETDIVTICLRANDETLLERLQSDKRRTKEEIEKRSKDLRTDKYNLDENSFDAYVPTDSISPIEIAHKTLDKVNQVRERGSIYYHKNFANAVLKSVLPEGYDLGYLEKIVNAPDIEMFRDIREEADLTLASVPLYFSEENYRSYVAEKGLDKPTRKKIGLRKILAISEVKGVIGIYLENREDTVETKKQLIDLFERELGEPTIKDESLDYNLNSYYTNKQSIRKSDNSPVKTTNLISYSSVKEGMPKPTDFPHTVSFVIVDGKYGPGEIGLLKKTEDQK